MIEILYEALSGALYAVFVCLILCGIVGVIILLGENSSTYTPPKKIQVEPKDTEVVDAYKDIRPAIDYLIAKEKSAAKENKVSKAPEKSEIDVIIERVEEIEEYDLPNRLILDEDKRREMRVHLLKLLNKEESVGRPANEGMNLVKRQIPEN